MRTSYQMKEKRIDCALKAWLNQNYASLIGLPLGPGCPTQPRLGWALGPGWGRSTQPGGLTQPDCRPTFYQIPYQTPYQTPYHTPYQTLYRIPYQSLYQTLYRIPY